MWLFSSPPQNDWHLAKDTTTPPLPQPWLDEDLRSHVHEGGGRTKVSICLPSGVVQ
jgi:hypothetical protein